jgi:hypothetical protein
MRTADGTRYLRHWRSSGSASFCRLGAAILLRMQGYGVASATAIFCLLLSMGSVSPLKTVLLGALFAAVGWLIVWSESKLHGEWP